MRERRGNGIMLTYPPLEALLPHRAPMILLDGVHDDTEQAITCKVTLRDTSPFVENGRVPAVVALEYMAQCVAAYAGLKAFREGTPVRLGYVIGARVVELAEDQFGVGEELFVSANRVWGDDLVGNFECRVDSRRRRVATAVLSVFQGVIDEAPIGRAVKRR